MNRSAPRVAYGWVRFFLGYVVFMGLVPLLSELRSLGNGHGINPHHNFELTWGLMHIVPALVGITVALWYLRHSAVLSAICIVALTFQVLFPLVEYRREGFDPRRPRGLEWTGYVVAMVGAAVPFTAAYLIARWKHPM